MVDKSNILPLECIELGSFYTFTINKAGNPTRYLLDVLKYCKILNQCVDTANYILYPEYSKRGRLHYHGKISFNTWYDVVRFYENLFVLLDQCCIEIDYIDDPLKWEIYVTKCAPRMEAYIKESNPKYPFTLTPQEVKKRIKIQPPNVNSIEQYLIKMDTTQLDDDTSD